MAKIKKTTLFVKGMHCPSCEVLINDKFREESNVSAVKPDFNSQKVEVSYTGKLNHNNLNSKIKPFGYQIITEREEMQEEAADPLSKRIFEAGAIGIILFILYLIVKELGILPNYDFTGNLNYLTIFGIGLVASTSTCMATSGALFLSTVGKNGNNFKQAITFSLGRILSYGLFGLIVGFIGKTLITTIGIGPFLTLLAAVFMILLGLDMARIISFAKIIPYGKSKRIFQKLEGQLIKSPKKTAFLLGAITYFLPCGFTQAVQVYALGQGSPLQSAITMMVFAVGTMPAILLIGSISSLTKSKFYPYFLKTMGMIVLMIGLMYFSNFLSLYGFDLSNKTNSTNKTNESNLANGVQTIDMKVVASGYEPSFFTVKKGIPVKWRINGVSVFGCQAYLVVPKLDIQRTINPGIQTIEFTPKETGFINFSCGMGMYRGRIEVVD